MDITAAKIGSVAESTLNAYADHEEGKTIADVLDGKFTGYEYDNTYYIPLRLKVWGAESAGYDACCGAGGAGRCRGLRCRLRPRPPAPSAPPQA